MMGERKSASVRRRTGVVALGTIALISGSALAAPNEARALRLQAKSVDTARPMLADGLERLTGVAASGKRFVLQLDGPMTPDRRAQLERAGVTLGEALGSDAFIAKLDRARGREVRGLGFIRWHSEFEAGWKLSPEIGKAPFTTPERQRAAADGAVFVVVHLFAGAEEDEIAAAKGAIARLPGTAVMSEETIAKARAVTLRTTRGQLGAIAALPAVQFVEEAPEFIERNGTVRGIVQSNDPASRPLYARGLRGEGQIIGIVDSAINAAHCSFSDVNPIGPMHRKILAYNIAPGSARHGTHVAATACGDAGAEDDTRGVAYLAKLVYNSIPSLTESSVRGRLDLHHSQGARIHSNSWGTDTTSQYTGTCRAIDSFMYDNEDDLVVLACSNSGIVTNPENAKNLLAVTATQDFPGQEGHCIGGTGPTIDGRRRPEIMAPGCDTFSAHNTTACGTLSQFGTSYATPAVSGIAALTRQYYMEGFYPTGAASPTDAFTPSGALLKATLINSAADMAAIAGYPSNQEGWGRLWIDRALYFPGDARRMLLVQDVRNAGGLTTGQDDQAMVSVGTGEPLKVTLTWTEPPAAAGSAAPSINNLDLEVIAPGGATYRGNVFAGGQSAAGGTADAINNTEQVLLIAPSAGSYTVRIVGTAVNQGVQGYALVVTGGAPQSAACVADIDGSGAVDIGDLAIVIANWATAGPAGDIDNSGEVGLGDIAQLIQLWTQPCP